MSNETSYSCIQTYILSAENTERGFRYEKAFELPVMTRGKRGMGRLMLMVAKNRPAYIICGYFPFLYAVF